MRLPVRIKAQEPVAETPVSEPFVAVPVVAGAQVVLIRMKEVQRRTGLSRPTLYRLVKDHKFPRPVRLMTHSVAWRQHEVDAWIQTRQQFVTSRFAARPVCSSCRVGS